MSFRKIFPAIALLFITSIASHAQTSRHSFSIGTQVPLQYTIGYEYQVSDHFSAQAQGGLLTAPYDQVILSVMKSFGVDDSLKSLIEDAFKMGTIVAVGTKYHFNENHYIGIDGQWIQLNGGGVAADLASAYFGRDISPLRQGSNTIPLELTLQSTLYMAGITYGRRFHFANPSFEIAAEISISKCFSSNNSFSSNHPRLDGTQQVKKLYSDLDSDLNFSYSRYVYVPTLNVYFVWHL
jgi:hypothetical protein